MGKIEIKTQTSKAFGTIISVPVAESTAARSVADAVIASGVDAEIVDWKNGVIGIYPKNEGSYQGNRYATEERRKAGRMIRGAVFTAVKDLGFESVVSK